MSDYKKVEEALDFIKKKGDMYDVIAQSQKKALSKHAFWELLLFLFSRIAFFGFSTLFVKNIKAFVSPVKKVYSAQEEIRKVLGVKVDIVRSKGDSICYSFGKEKKDIKEFLNYGTEVAILYENKNSSLSSYVQDLKKIYSFCKLHKLKKVLLNTTDIPFDVPKDITVVWLNKVLGCNPFISSLEKKEIEKLQKQLNVNYDFSDKLYDDVLCMNLKQLHCLIKKMESFQIDKEFICYLSRFIKDKALDNAISLYVDAKDLSCFQQFINSRLTLFMNYNSGIKDKRVGKINQEIKISGEWLQITNRNQDGKILENSIVSFYNYLDVRDFPSLLKKLEFSLENKELYAYVALYLYLFKESKEISSSNSDSISLYDFYYKMYQEKKKKKISKIPALFDFNMRFTNWWLKCMEGVVVYGSIWCITYLLTAILTVFGPNEVWNLEKFNTIKDKIETICLESLEFEMKCVLAALNQMEDLFSIHEKEIENVDEVEEKNEDPFSKKKDGTTVGDSTVKTSSKNEVIATITPLKEDISLPIYYAVNHANIGDYFRNFEKSEMYYSFYDYTVYSPTLEKTISLFEVSHALADLDYIVDSGDVSFFTTTYPVGDNYVLTSVTISDKEDISKKIILDADLVSGKRFLLEEERELLSSMENPEIHFAYGISLEHGNSFANQLNNISFYTENFSEVRNAIIKGLNLSFDATNEEIFAAIKKKKYSKTPIEDAGLTEEIQKMDELEFYEAVASMDSLICNLAASLAVSVEQELIYTVGYLNSDDLYITSDEAHAWGMKNNGEIVDVTPSEPYHFIRDTLYAILWWSLDHHLSLYAILLGFGIVLEKKFGKKVAFQFKMKRIERLTMDSDIEKVYAKLNAMLYGGINFPVNRKPYEFVNRIAKDFYGLTEEELYILKKVLQENKLQNQEEQRLALKLIDSIPFMLENQEELERVLRKEK